MARESREVWAERVDRWQQSGQSAREFAEANGWNVWTLRGWRAKLTSRPARSRVRSSRTDTRKRMVREPAPGLPFVEVLTSVGGRSGDDRIEIILPGPTTVRVPVRFDVGALRELLALLRAD